MHLGAFPSSIFFNVFICVQLRSKWQLLKICKKQEKFNELEHEKERARVQVQKKLLQINILL
jgi:hypothetical protein